MQEFEKTGKYTHEDLDEIYGTKMEYREKKNEEVKGLENPEEDNKG